MKEDGLGTQCDSRTGCRREAIRAYRDTDPGFGDPSIIFRCKHHLADLEVVELSLEEGIAASVLES